MGKPTARAPLAVFDSCGTIWGGTYDMLSSFVSLAETELIPHLRLVSPHPHDPVEVRGLPVPWELLGTGNYAAVLTHPEYPAWAVKVYAPGRPGLAEEIRVYRQLGAHPAYSKLLHAGAGYLVLKRLRGITLYECLRQGVRIPVQVIREVDEALDYARQVGLCPRDVHAKNVIMHEGHGFVADISDFGRPGGDTKWEDFKRAYYTLYRPTLGRWTVPVPGLVLTLIRKGYRWARLLVDSSD